MTDIHVTLNCLRCQRTLINVSPTRFLGTFTLMLNGVTVCPSCEMSDLLAVKIEEVRNIMLPGVTMYIHDEAPNDGQI